MSKIELGQKFAEAMQKANNALQGVKNKAKPTAVALATALTMTACDWQPSTGSTFSTAKGDYLDGTTTELLQENQKKTEVLIDIYNEYFDSYEKRKKVVVELASDGDHRGAAIESQRIADLEKMILETEEEIDKLRKEKLNLQEYKKRGRRNAVSSQVKKS